MAKSSREPKVTEAQIEPVDNEDLDQADDQPVSHTEEAASEETGTLEQAAAELQDWWSASQPAGDWAQPSEGSGHSQRLFLRPHKLLFFEPGTSRDCKRETHGIAAFILGRRVGRSVGAEW